MFEAEFCPNEQKHARELARDTLLQAIAVRTGIPIERLKLAITSGRYIEYRRQRLAREMPSVPPKFRGR
ncbi:MAG: hypothetical protein C5B50_26670 [Verrucomicrobia bacterium]|nr:MAG: hypothetical protein C5B50_26670 [Verrucomicrobiota bacterium]